MFSRSPYPNLLKKPSQLINFPLYFIFLFVFVLGTTVQFLPNSILSNRYKTFLSSVFWGSAIIGSGYSFLKTATHTYRITDEQLIEKSGIFFRHTEQIELFRIEDYSIAQPLFLRPFHLGTLTIISNDHTTPVLNLVAIYDPEGTAHIIRSMVSNAKNARRLHHLSYGNTDDINLD